jgi:hypothetical protein
MRARRLEPKRLRLVHSHSGGEASLALIEASKDGRKELKILPPLTIYTEHADTRRRSPRFWRERRSRLAPSRVRRNKSLKRAAEILVFEGA